MAEGLGFKTFATGDVLTAADTNGYLMQGVWVFADAAARDAAVTSPQEGNFAYLKDTNTTTYYDGSVWANLDTTGMVNPMTTTGDTIYSSSGSTPARLGIGTAGQVLTVNSGATAPEWITVSSGGMTLLSTTTLSGTSTTVTGISGSYTNLTVIISGVDQSLDDMFVIYPNNISNNSFQARLIGGTGSNDVNLPIRLTGNTAANNQLRPSTTNNAWAVTFNNYATSNTRKSFSVSGVFQGSSSTATADIRTINGAGGINADTAITELVFRSSGGSATFAAGEVKIYGVK